MQGLGYDCISQILKVTWALSRARETQDSLTSGRGIEEEINTQS